METSHLQRYLRGVGCFGWHDRIISIPIARLANVSPWHSDLCWAIMPDNNSGDSAVDSLLLLEQEGDAWGDCHCKSSRIPIHLLNLASG
jgi:hypothetical protein